MWFTRFVESMPGRLLRVALGLWLIGYGATHPSLVGLVLMMVGMVPTVTGLADICLCGGFRTHRRAKNPPPGDWREGHAQPVRR